MEPINESYLIKQIQLQVAARLGVFMRLTGDLRIPSQRNWDEYVREIVTDYWRKDDQIFWLFRYPHMHLRDKRSSMIKFRDPRYDPSASKIWYGKPVPVQDVEEHNASESKIFDNRKGEELQTVEFEESVELNNSVEHSFSSSMTFDTTVSSETTVGGSYGGVSAEEKVTATFGFTDEKSKSETKSESKTETESVKVNFDVPPGHCVLLEILKEHSRIQTPFVVDGVLDFGFDLNYNDWANGPWFHYVNSRFLSFDSLEKFYEFLRGYDTNHPKMKGFWEHCAQGYISEAIGWVLKEQNRRIQMAGIKERVLEQNATYRNTDLGHSIPDDLKHLKVVEMDHQGR